MGAAEGFSKEAGGVAGRKEAAGFSGGRVCGTTVSVGDSSDPWCPDACDPASATASAAVEEGRSIAVTGGGTDTTGGGIVGRIGEGRRG